MKIKVLFVILFSFPLIQSSVNQVLPDNTSVLSPPGISPETENSDHSGYRVTLNVDWPAYMEKHKLVWEIFPGRWENAPFIGNGLTGAMIYGSTDSARVRWYLGRSDVGKLGKQALSGGRIQIGSLDLITAGKILFDECYAELDIWNGEASGTIRTTRGEISWRSFAVLDAPAIIIELYGITGDEKECHWEAGFTNPGKERLIDGVHTWLAEDKETSERIVPGSAEHTIAWAEDNTSPTRILYVAIGGSRANKKTWDNTARSSLSSLQEALTAVTEARKKGVSDLRSENQDWWHGFYPQSFMSVPRLDCESYYWIQLYKMASTSRKGYPMIDCAGIWSVEPGYPNAVWDLNVQSTYRLHLKSNHLDLGEPLISFMDRNFNEKTMWYEGLGELRARMLQKSFLHFPFETDTWELPPHRKFPPLPADGPGQFLWACHNYWMQYRYSMADSMQRNLLLMLEGGINGMAAALEKEDDGKLHIPVGRNWEIWIGKDVTELIGILDWALTAARIIGTRLDYDKQKLSRWAYLQKNLVAYPTGIYPNGKPGYLLGTDQVPLRHRHWSHLLMIFPLCNLSWDEENKRDLIINSIDYWSFISSGLDGKKPTSGYAPCASICLYAYTGQNDKIPDLIDIFLYKESDKGNTGPIVWANTMYRENAPASETPLLFASSLQELLLQSYNGIIKVFPALPAEWREASFYDFRTEGGFLISAKYSNGTTEFIKINSLSGEDFTLETRMEPIEYAYSGKSRNVRELGDNRYKIQLAKGDSLLLYNPGAHPDFTVSPVQNQSGRNNSYGLNQAFLEKREYIKNQLFREN